MAVCLVQLSDLHLGRAFGSLGLPAALRESLRATGVDIIRRASELVRIHDAAALLVPGDLFDRPEIDESLYTPVRELWGDLGRPVLVSPGNHDAFGALSVWNNAALGQLGLAPWPENVRVFDQRELTPHKLLDGALIIHGHRVEGYHSPDDSPLRSVRCVPEADWNVLSFHGALRSGPGNTRGTVPFTVEQLAEIGADYAAVGHYHRHQRIEHQGQLLGAYAGVPVPGEWDEDPHGGVLVVHLSADGPQVQLDVPYPGRVATLGVHGEPPFADRDEVITRVDAAATAAGLGAEDITLVQLTGFSRFEVDPAALAEVLGASFLHVVVRDETLPDVAAVETAHGGARVTVESQFLAHVEQALARAATAAERARLEAARRYGLLALRGRPLRPPAATVGPSAEGSDHAD